MELFVTGTDTDCGKTLITLGLMARLEEKGGRVAGMKPVASGATRTSAGLRNDDALAIQAACHLPFPYDWINPCCLESAVAPHLAAAAEGRSIDLEAILAAAARLRAEADHLVVEGAGGWRVPLTQEADMAGLCRMLELPVVLVVGLKLGCLNHALLSAESILASGCRLAGWVATSLAPDMPLERENIDTLRALVPAPFLGHVPWQARPEPGFTASRIALPEAGA